VKERLNKADFIDTVRRNVVGEWHISQSPLSFKKIASLIRCSETNVYIRSRDQDIIEALNRSDVYLENVNNLKSFVYQPKNH
jgi:hypothetical protein